VVTALIAGSIGYVIGDQHSRITAAALGGEAGSSGCGNAPDPSATSSAAAALTARLLPMPAGASPVNLLKQGELSLDDYVQELYGTSSDAMQRLTALCFQAGAFREWSLPSGNVVAIWLAQFASNDGARSYILGTEQADSDTAGNTVRFTVPGVGDGTGIARPSIDKDGNTLCHLLGDNGGVAMLIHVYVPGHLDDAFATQVLQQQNARL
jgi:hypothetical protein